MLAIVGASASAHPAENDGTKDGERRDQNDEREKTEVIHWATEATPRTVTGPVGPEQF